MKILVLGATGRVGRHVIEVATERGHQVTAFARKPDAARRQNVDPFPGDALRPARVAEAVPGHDAVVSALGKRGDEPTLTEGLRNLLAAMRQHDVRRIVVVGAQGVLDDPRGGLVRDRPAYPPFLQEISAEHLAAFRELQASGLDWSMLCPPRMTEGSVGSFSLSANAGPVGSAPAEPAEPVAIGYRDAAEAILDMLEEERFIGQRVAIEPAEPPS
jgi:putative NADH-flavin reductase